MRCFIDLTRGCERVKHRVRLTIEASKDISTWLEFLQTFNGRLCFLPIKWISSHVLRLTTDMQVGLHRVLPWVIRGYWAAFPLHGTQNASQ